MTGKLRYNMPKFLVFSDQAVVSGSSFVTNIIIARSLGITGYGKFSVLILIQLFLLSIQQSAFSSVYQVLHGRFDKELQRDYTNGVFYKQILLYIGILILACGAYLFIPSMSTVYESVFFPAIMGTVLFLFQDFLRKVLITQQKEGKALMIDIISNTTQLILLAAFAWFNMLTLSNACWIIFLTFIPSAVAGISWVKPGWWSAKNVVMSWHHHKSQSGWMLLSALLQWFTGNFFVVAAGWWLGLAALGALRLAQYIFGLLNVVIQAIENYALPAASKLAFEGNLLNVFLKKVFVKSLLVMTPFLAAIVIFAKPLLVLSGGEAYQEYAYVMYGLTLSYLLIITAIPVRIALRVSLLNRYYFLGYILAAVFSMLSARYMIGEWQLTGVLYGLFMTQFIVITYWLYILNRKKVFVWKLFTSY
jgi:O-antigen/teichoic acid export membrane protein